ncbi:MAG: ATP-dependent helicase [Phycisphaeraceae bacterium]|nr:ATP-dependent helicase [Phycisphaeraceae bacterium]
MARAPKRETADDGLELFHPLVADWFTRDVGTPTDVQSQAWRAVADGRHVLVTAPTGSGKTLTAFLWALDRLATGGWPDDATSVLYVSPLKALNNDIQRNLILPLGRLRDCFERAATPFPDIRVLTRSGDTPQSDRRRMLRHPPQILITTPESLNLMLGSAGGQSILTQVRTVILDEIHAVIDNRRGTHLMTAVERLSILSGEFQRIALSATVRPLEIVARFVGGFERDPDAPATPEPRLAPRSVDIVTSDEKKTYDVTVRYIAPQSRDGAAPSVWAPIVDELRAIIGRRRSTLVFTNSRRLCERIALLINDGEPELLAYAHHGSLSREVRSEVERRLKHGVLQAIVSTSSLEMGIDIGALDEVVMIQSPPSVSSAVQRVGRAGHQVGEVSRGTIVPTHAHDLIAAAVLAAGIVDHDIEAVRPVECPLDVLAQVIISITSVETLPLDEIYARVRACHAYRQLSRDQFDLVAHMLAGRYADHRIRALTPRISIDGLDGTAAARKSARHALYMSGGVIPDRGAFQLRHHETHARLGDLDEEFVWEASAGQTFALGTQNWKIERITHNDVLVRPGPARSTAAPFWKAEGASRDFHFSQRIGAFLEEANERIDDPEYARHLTARHRLDNPAADALIELLESQKRHTGCDLPHRHHLVVESIESGPGGAPGSQIVLHTLWGGRLNRPYAMALDAAWERRFGDRAEIYPADDCVAIQMVEPVEPHELIALVRSADLQSLLEARLEGSGFFGARFRECAGRALLLTRDRPGRRMPLWVSRLRSQKLLDAVSRYEDFPMLLEAWRCCLRDEFDMEGLRQVLGEVESGAITWTATSSKGPSPLARGVAWSQINQYMYMDDTPRGDHGSRLRRDLVRDLVLDQDLRPTVAPGVVERFERKRQRLADGYPPAAPRDLVDWVRERLLIPQSQWQVLLETMARDGTDIDDILRAAADRLVRIVRPDGAPLVAARELAGRIAEVFFDPDAARIEPIPPAATAPVPAHDRETDREATFVELLGQWLGFYGPIAFDSIRATLGVEDDRLVRALDTLCESGTLVRGRLVEGEGEEEYCDAENFEALLRLARAEAAPAFDTLEAPWLTLFLAVQQGMTAPREDAEGLSRCVEQLNALPMPAASWEAEILPARVASYDPAWLDSLMQASGLLWVGDERRRVCFCFETDLDLIEPGKAGEAGEGGQGSEDEDAGSPPDPLPAAHARYDFAALLAQSGAPASDLAEQLWSAVWRGRITNDTFVALRRGIESDFKVPTTRAADAAPTLGRRRPGRGHFARWRSSVPFAGNWHRIDWPARDDDLLETEQRRRDRVRVLLDRYGIVFRQLLERERPEWRWSSLFRTLRLMELSGEVVSGCFFHGISGPQFVAHATLRVLTRGLPERCVYWMNATDPASPCGLGIEGLDPGLPRRVVASHVVFRGAELVMTSKRHGGDLTFQVPPDDDDLQACLGVLRHLLTRRFQPRRRLVVETINDEPAGKSPYVDALRVSFDVSVEHKQVVLFRKMS